MTGLHVENLNKRYGKLSAVRDLTFDAPAGALTCLIGPNGAANRPPSGCSRDFNPRTADASSSTA